MLALLLSVFGKLAPGIAATIGDYLIKSKQTQAAEDTQAVSLATSYLASVTDANRARVEARKNEGTWGPLGLVTAGIGGAFVFHVWAVVFDSVPLFGHIVGSWHVATLGAFNGAEIEAIRALFYTAPPAAAAIAIAKVFRRK